MTTEEKLEINYYVKQLKKRDKVSFKNLYKKMYNVLYCFLMRYCSLHETIEDTISDSFITIWNKAQEKMYYKNCYGWILRIAKFTLNNNLRKNKNTVSYDQDDELKKYVEGKQTKTSDNSLDIYLKSLPNETYRLIYMKIYEGLTFEEISATLHVSRSTTIRKYNEVIKYLEENLDEERKVD